MKTLEMPPTLSRGWLAAIAICLSIADLAIGRETTTKPDLAGTVKDKTGQPVSNASVFIYTAGPRQGAGYLCPSCYADCRKSARTDAAGKFKIESLDPTLVFRILVVASNSVPKFVNKVDPVKAPINVTVEPRSSTNLIAKHTILGRVVDAKGKPLETAIVSVHSTKIGNTGYGSPPAGTDPIAVTDSQGEFFLASLKPFDSMELQVEAAGFARGNFPEVLPGRARRDFKLTEGAFLSGKVIRDGKSLPNASVGVVSVDRSMGQFTGDFVVATRDDGTFLFVNLPPNREYFLYGMMDSLQKFGVISARKIQLGEDGSNKDAGELAVSPGHRLAGQVKLSDDKPLPDHTRLMVNRRDAWDHIAIVLPPDGKFDLPNIPAESIDVSAHVEGYRHSARNASLDRLNPFGLAGRLDADKTNLTILLEPGEMLASEYGFDPESERPENLPLCGIEAKRTNANPWIISGHVIDAETKAPLSVFHLTPGRQQIPKSHTQWQRSRAADYTNGVYSLELAKTGGWLVLMAEAEGYLPAVSEPIASELNAPKIGSGLEFQPDPDLLSNGDRASNKSHNKYDLQLKKGEGPHGVLLLPDGKPADGVSVYYLGPGEQGGFDKSGKFSVYSFDGSPAKTLTDPDGAFDFAPKLPGGDILAANQFGSARIGASELAPNGKLTLQPWAHLKGKLMKDGKPVAGEDVDLTLEDLPANRAERPHIHLPSVKTGDDGSFSFERVPAGALGLNTRLKFGEGQGWTTQLQQKFTVQAGADLDLGPIIKLAPSRTGLLGR